MLGLDVTWFQPDTDMCIFIYNANKDMPRVHKWKIIQKSIS